MQRSAGEVSPFVAHFFVFGASRDEATAKTHEMTLEAPLWSAFEALLAAARFWDIPRRTGAAVSTGQHLRWRHGTPAGGTKWCGGRRTRSSRGAN